MSGIKRLDFSRRHQEQESDLSLLKTFSFFFPTENERLTKDSSLTANDLETSEIPYSSHFALNQKTLFLNAKVIIFFER